jgi:RNA polymerase sigma-70 factor, ECF subfamily
VDLGKIIYHPEAILCTVAPADALAPLRAAALAAARVGGHDITDDDEWRPHVTMCYSTSDQPAAPVPDNQASTGTVESAPPRLRRGPAAAPPIIACPGDRDERMWAGRRIHLGLGMISLRVRCNQLGSAGCKAVMNETGKPANGRASQFTEVFGSCYGPVLAYALRRVGPDLAHDVVADAFLAAWRNVEKLPLEPLPWLYRAAQFAIANQRRAAARRDRLSDRARLEAASYRSPDLSEGVVADLELAAALRTLSEADREILRLAAWEGLAPATIGEVIGCSAGAAKARLHRARKRLSRRLGLGQAHNSLAQLTGTTAQDGAT